MTSMFYDIRRIIKTTPSRSLFFISRILSILGISRAWYYRQLHLPPIIDKRVNPFKVRDEELRVLKYRNLHEKMNFPLFAYSMIDRNIAYLSPSEVYKIPKKYDLIKPWERLTRQSSKPERTEHPDERLQVDIM
ncbi:MAG: helix-turn-helix domain-containing protein [Thermoplasmatales archaeon]